MKKDIMMDNKKLLFKNKVQYMKYLTKEINYDFFMFFS